jgi:hypothetical protein
LTPGSGAKTVSEPREPLLGKPAGTMVRFLQLRWIGRERILAYCKILALCSAVSLYPIFQQAMSAEGSDFLAFWSAARLTIIGAADQVYNPSSLSMVQAALGRHDVFAFVSPPPLLLVIWPLGYLSFPVAWLVWVVVTYAAWLWLTRRLYAALEWPIAAYPGALLAAWHAQTGFLTSALQAGAANWLETRPFRAGLLIGALVVKPQLVVLFPVALLAARQWRAVAGALTSVVALFALSWLFFGTATMLAYPQAWAVSEYLLRTESESFFVRQETVYAMVRLILGTDAAAIMQTAVTALVVVLTWAAWSRSGPLEGKLALLFAATPLATPYLFSYDLPFLVIPVCWLAQTHQRQDPWSWNRTFIVALYIAPLATRAIALPLGINLMPIVSALTVFLVWGRLRGGHAHSLPKTDVHAC